MIETAMAVRYYGKVEQGRTAPSRVQAEAVNGASIDVILKATDPYHLTVEGLANEMLGALLAGDLDLPTPRPVFVELSPDFIASIPDGKVRDRLSAGSPIALGSTDASAQ